MLWTRRAAIASASAVAACGAGGGAPTILAPDASLKAAPFPVGASVMASQLDDARFRDLIEQHISQLTPEWEMKMEYILLPDGDLRFDAPDRIAAFAYTHDLALFGHTLIWYAQDGAHFRDLANDRTAFGQAYDDYIRAVVSRYAPIARGWDVVNEPVNEDGSGLRDSLWSQTLGDIDHIVRAFDQAAEADPDATLFLNDYNLEWLPAKRTRFMHLAETLLERGCKLGGLGTQTHIDIDLPLGAVREALSDLASFGLPVHLSELDISTNMRPMDLRSNRERLHLQARQAEEAAQAYMALPEAQRFGFTLWGLRDSDSWLRGPNGTGPNDQPALFDDFGGPKPALAEVIEAFGGA